MATVEEIIGKKPVSDVTVESIIGRRPISEPVPVKMEPGTEERQQFLKNSSFEVGLPPPSDEEISPYIKAIPPTLWELVKTQVPGGKLLSEEFKQSSWWLKKSDLPADFDNIEFSPLDIIGLIPALSEAYLKLSPTEFAEKFRTFKQTAQEKTKTGKILDEVLSLESFIFFPAQMKMLGDFVGPVVSKYAPTLYKILTKEISFGRKTPGKIPEVKPPEVIPEIKPEIRPVNRKGYLAAVRDEEGNIYTATTHPEAYLKMQDMGGIEPNIRDRGWVVNGKYLRDSETSRIKIEKTLDELEKSKIPEPGQTFSEPQGAFESTVKFDPHEAMAEAATDSMIAKGIKRDPTKLMTEQLVDEWLKDPSKYENIISKYGMTPQEWAGIMREQASSWGRKLGEIGIEAKKLGKEIPEIGEALSELEKIASAPSAWDKIQNGWKNIDRVRRGLLVTQLSTAMRNGFSQAGRVGLDVPEKAMNYYLAKLFGLEPKGSPLDGVEQLFNILNRGESKKIAETVLNAFPKQYSRLYSTYMSDIEVGTAGQTISKGVDILNTANRFQEFLFRNGVFSSALEQGLKQSGKSLTNIIEKNLVSEIPREVVEKAVSKALEMTFAETPKYGTIGKKFVDFVTSMPGATFLLPFPRFMINSLKFNFEYSPFGLLKYLSASERAAFAAGDVQVMSRAILGTTMLGTAWQIRNSEYAGEKWNEIKVGNKTIDMIAYNPFSVYFFVADIIKKAKDGTLYRLTGKDVSMGVLSSNLRAGVGLAAVDQVMNGLSQTGDSEKAANVLKGFAGEVGAGILTPLNQIKELMVGFDDYIVKSKREEPFWGPIKEKIPIVEQSLPVLYSATREGPVTRELSALRQLSGFSIKTKNVFEKELDRLGFSYQEIVHSTGDPRADNLIKKYMGMMAQNMAIPLIESEEYKSLTQGQKALTVANLLNEIRSTAKEAAEEENPNLFVKIQLERIPKRQRIIMEEEGINIKELEKQLTQ